MSKKESNYESNYELNRSDKMYKTCAVGLVCLAVVQSAILIGLTAWWSQIRTELVKPIEQNLTVPISSVLPPDVESVPLALQNLRVQNDTDYVGSASEILTALSNYAVETQFDGDATPETYDIGSTGVPKQCTRVEDEPWIKLTTLEKLVAISEINSTKAYWRPPTQDMYDMYDADQGDVVVNKTGTYFVTAQIEAACPEGQDNIDEPLRIHIFLKQAQSSDIPRCILQNARSKCDKQNGVNRVSSSIGAVFKLHKEDRLYVAITNQTSTSPNVTTTNEEDFNNFFAVHML